MQNGTVNFPLSKILKVMFVCVTLPALVACGGSESDGAHEAGMSRLPVSINEVMVAMVNQAADPIWGAIRNNPQTERDWRELERLSYQIQIGGALLAVPGTGPLDDAWVANPQWRQLANQLSQDGVRAVNAVRSRNMDLMKRAGDQLIETCEACHRAFKPDLPTLDMFGELPVISL